MKKLFLSSIIASYALAANIGVSILPQEQIVKKLLPDAKVITLMPVGADPHTYEPKPSQMKELSKADVFLGIGVEVEEVWLKRLAENTKVKVVHTDEGIKKSKYSQIELIEDEHHHDHHEHHHNHDHHDHHHDHSGLDVHIWTDPFIIKKLAINSANALKEALPKESVKIDANLQKFKKELDELNLKLYDLTKDLNVRGFISAHPSWGYFAKRYDLEEYTLELEGKELKPKELAKVIEVAKQNKACIVLKAPQFSDKLANVLHKESGLKIVQINPLEPNFTEELIKFANILKENCSNTITK